MAIVLFNNPDSLQSMTLGTSETVIRRVLRAGMANSVKQNVGVRSNRNVITWQAVWMVRESGWYHLCLYNIYMSIICDSSHRFTLFYFYGKSKRTMSFVFVFCTYLLGVWQSAYIHRELFYSIEAWSQIWNIHGSPFLIFTYTRKILIIYSSKFSKNSVIQHSYTYLIRV